MWRRTLTVAAGLSILGSASQAQDGAMSARQLTFALGPLFMATRDVNASPLRYTGTGTFLEFKYSTRTVRRRVTVRVGGGLGTLQSALTHENGLPHQDGARAWIELEYARDATGKNRRTRLYLGGVLAVQGTGVIHRYGAPSGNDGGYGFYRASLGPVVAVEQAMGEGKALTVQIGVPALTMIGRPYGSVHSVVQLAPANVALRVVSVPAFLAADFRAAYSARIADWGAIVIGHQLAVEHYRGAEAFRVASQGVSIGIAMRLKGNP